MSTIVSFHAHPDDEVLMTGGTLARLAAEGHRVVLVVATDGAKGLSDDGRTGTELAGRRRDEVERSAQILGCARVVHLGYADSGWAGGADPTTDPLPGSFAAANVGEAAERLAAVLREEQADLLTVYDRYGGYGHLDHVRVHTVGLDAAHRANTPRVVQATVDRTHISRAVRILGLLRVVPPGTATQHVPSWYSAREEITHRVSVRRFADQKRAALACHASQAGGGSGPRTAGILLRLPRPAFRRLLGTEWFVEIGVDAPRRPLDDLMTSARQAGR